MIPYPDKHNLSKSYKIVPTSLRDNFNLTEDLLEYKFEYIPVPQEDGDQDIILR